jgi:Homing endonuclease associated repeat
MPRAAPTGKGGPDLGDDAFTREAARGELFKSRAAEVVFQGFLALDRADQHAFADALLRELTTRQPRATPSRKLAEGIRAVREAAKLLGAPPRLRRYEALRRQHPDWRWPPAGTLRRWLGAGSWEEALRRAGLPTAIPGDAVESLLGPAFTPDEGRLAVQRCAEDLGRVPSFSEYHAWAHRPDVTARSGRRPLSEGPFCRLFGSFQNAITAAGLADDPRSASVAANGNLRAAHYRVGNEQISEGLREVAARLGHVPNTSEYIFTRETMYEESRARGQPRVLPSFPTIMRRYRRWRNALEAAGLTANRPNDLEHIRAPL